MSWKPPITEVTAPNMNRVVKVAKRDRTLPNKSGKIFNTETGQIAEWNSQLVATWQNWEYITDSFYPVYEKGVYMGTAGDAKRGENNNSESEENPINWRCIKRVPFARWDDFIEKTEDDK